MEREQNGSFKQEDDEEKETFWTFHKKIHLAILMAGSFLNWVAYDVLSTFYPFEAQAKGVNNTVIGLIFGMFPLVSVMTSFVYGTWMFVIGPYRLMFAGMVLNGIMLVLFAFVTLLPNRSMFIIVCSVLRIFSAIGASAFENASTAICIKAYKPCISIVLGITELVLNLGLAAGPVIGGTLYDIGGFKLPFLVVGGSLLVGAPIYYYAMSKKEVVLDKQKEVKGSMLKAFSIPAIVIMVFACPFGFMLEGFITANLAKHLEKFGLNSTEIGLFFGTTTVIYAILCLVFGYITDKMGSSRVVVVGSLVVAGCGWQLLGPSPFLPFLPQRKLWLAAISSIIYAISAAAIFATFLLDMVKTARKEGMPDDPSTDGVISAVFIATLNVALFAGAFGGGILVDNFGFRMSSSILGIVGILQALALTIFIMWDRLQKQRLRTSDYQQLKSTEPDETSITDNT